ncbi:MAG TPA: hypothetical protein VK789_11295, partial [Bryobacteraceae bacterium]|nr:hypothetical protein [Bryobacteraceae bacterium]
CRSRVPGRIDRCGCQVEDFNPLARISHDIPESAAMPYDRHRGAGTRACRAGTLPGAWAVRNAG